MLTRSAVVTGFVIASLAVGTFGLIQLLSSAMPRPAARKAKAKKVITKPTPEQWVRVGQLAKLIIYPIKSCQGIEVNEARLTPLGLQGLTAPEYFRDRMFVVTDSKGTFQTQRVKPTLALIQIEFIEDDKLKLSAPEREPLICDLRTCLQPVNHTIRVWTDYYDAKDVLDLGDEVGTWVDNFLNVTGFRIIYHAGNSTKRAMTTVHDKFPLFAPEDTGTFQDETSYMLMTAESIDMVNQKLDVVGAKSSYKNFRPTLFVDGISEPFNEDSWSFIRIGDVENGPILKAAMPCSRCKLTTVDPETGTFHPDGEPVKTILAELKRKVADPITTELVKNQGILGIHFGLLEGDNSMVKVGDPIFATFVQA